jgi:hypothetical protein
MSHGAGGRKDAIMNEPDGPDAGLAAGLRRDLYRRLNRT